MLIEMRSVATRLSGADDLMPLGAALVADLDRLERTLSWILEHGKNSFAEVLAGAVPFLHLLGSVCGSWQMGRAALVASAGLAEGRGDANYLQGIVDLAHFHFGQLAPQAESLARTVVQGGASVVGAGEAAFG